jgi:nitrogen fixation/metabolism regulation signal transduction histidine kinase
VGTALWEHREWLLVAEAFFVLSFLAGWWLVRALFRPMRLLREAVDFIQAGEFATRMRETGRPELDPLIQVYNRMADTLRRERVRSEEQEHFLQRVLQASPTGVITLDLEGRVTMANPSAEALLRRGDEELTGRALSGLGSPLADALASMEPEESLLVPLQGRRRIRCRMLTFMDRGFARRFLLMDELTEELHRSEKAAYEKLIRMTSHEVSNTAAAVGSLLQSCLRYADQLSEPDRADFAGALGVAIARTGRMNTFVQDFAEVVRLPAPRRLPGDVNGLLQEVGLLLREDSARRRVEWVWEVDGGLPPVSMDATQMEQVFLNVCKNGLEAIGEDGTLTVRTGLDRGRPFAVIRDSGGGIPPEAREQLFTPFFTTKRDGQGIGLTLVQEVLLAHGFDFSLEGDGAGGTEFTVLF